MSRKEIEEKLKKLEESFIQGRISEETYKELKTKYEAELASLSHEAVKPAGLGDLFSKALDFCTDNPVVFIPPVLSGIISAILGAIFGISVFGMFRGLRPPIRPRVPWVPIPRILGFLAITLLGFIVMMLISLIFNGWTIAIVKQGIEQNLIDLSESLSYTVSRLGALIVASILVAIIIGVGFLLCVIPGIIAAILLALTLQAVIVDAEGAFDALSTSYKVVRENFFDVLIIVIVQFVVEAILGIIPYIGWILAGLASAYFIVLLTLLYYERKEIERKVLTV